MVRGLVSVLLWLWRLFPPVLLKMSSVLVGNCVGEEKLPRALRKMNCTMELLLLTYFLLALDIFCYYCYSKEIAICLVVGLKARAVSSFKNKM